MAPTTMYVTVAGAGDNQGSTWARAFALADWLDDMTNNAEAGDLYNVYTGTYTLVGDFSTALDGSATNPIRIVGVSDQGVPPTPATGDDRPLIAANTRQCRWGDYWEVNRVRGTTTEAQGFRVDAGGKFINCNGNNSSGAAALYLGNTDALAIDCEAQAASGTAIYLQSNRCGVFGCYVHDSDTGIRGKAGAHIAFNLIDSCPDPNDSGIDLGAEFGVLVLANTIYNCNLGIEATTAKRCTFVNNIVDSCLLGAGWGTEQKSNYWDWNNWKNNTSDVTNVTKGPNALAVDPDFIDAANGNFWPRNWKSLLGFPGVFPGGLSEGRGLICGAVQPRRAVRLVG